MNWIDSSVDDFCRGMGLDTVDFASTGRVQLTFQLSGTLHIERHQDNLFLMLSRGISWHQSSDLLKDALALCNFDNGWPFSVRTGLLGEETLVFSAQINGEEVTIPSLEQAFALLIRLHNEVVGQ
ncbi:type III secretion chaperone SycN [Vibrio tubiashii]|jgi:type III secretion system chaperone SycN|uniref:Type III secretion protein n=1 Tax=Vibrio tubiashii ATCC 19109 TaxID=1051646 RepID=F9T799_9VIBR|nr:type III secretion chaperone SycN [Vibrio tubiashii]AIW14373.1 type III secretion protein [Vibrio tubiashii ATCC 19109]EGU53829.1 hypothetical protein VITU9109_23240 [Vibrio tubiashii ATCC 19109]EIF03932.1 hypothetical protein VT1337_10772 [Vibrio tubiashii NCIMB 1337 = ATCC 19106]MCG9577589.1 type III secretion chaperone SycN [Vibrio tubiashii]MCG9582231.1 type III secretion chaperone SycN [Vibrio tubiashii]